MTSRKYYVKQKKKKLQKYFDKKNKFLENLLENIILFFD